MKDNYVFILDLGDWDFHEGDRDELYDDDVFMKMIEMNFMTMMFS
jgi:hypothetical protein